MGEKAGRKGWAPCHNVLHFLQATWPNQLMTQRCRLETPYGNTRKWPQDSTVCPVRGSKPKHGLNQVAHPGESCPPAHRLVDVYVERVAVAAVQLLGVVVRRLLCAHVVDHPAPQAAQPVRLPHTRASALTARPAELPCTRHCHRRDGNVRAALCAGGSNHSRHDEMVAGGKIEVVGPAKLNLWSVGQQEAHVYSIM